MIYSILRGDIQNWTSNTDPEFLLSINGFIRQAENLIQTTVRLPASTEVTAITAVAGAATATMPEDFVSVDYISFPGYGMLEKKDTSFIKEVYPDEGEVGPVRYFGMQDDLTVMWGPTPDADYVGQMQYFSDNQSITSITPGLETFISRKYPVALLQGSLMFAAVWEKDKESQETHKELFYESLGMAKMFAKGRAAKQDSEKNNAAVESGPLS